MKWWQHYAGAIAFGAVLVVAAVGYVLVAGKASDANTSAQEAHQFARQGFDVVVDAARVNCRQDRKFRVQYKRRGRAVVVLLHIVALEEKKVRTSPGAHAALDRLRPLIHDIHIIPIPTCHDQIVRLRRQVIAAQVKASGES